MKNLIKLSLVSTLALSICSPNTLHASTSSTLTADDLSRDVSKRMRTIYESTATRDNKGGTSYNTQDLEVHGRSLVDQLARTNYVIPQDLLKDCNVGSLLYMMINTIIGELNMMEKLDESVKVTTQILAQPAGAQVVFPHFPWGDPDSWDEATKKLYFGKLLPVLKPYEALFLTPGTEQFDADFVAACMQYAPDLETQKRYAQALFRNLQSIDFSEKSPLSLEKRFMALETGLPFALKRGLLESSAHSALSLVIQALLRISNNEIEPLLTPGAGNTAASRHQDDDSDSENSQDDPENGRQETLMDFVDLLTSYWPYGSENDHECFLYQAKKIINSVGLTERITLLHALKNSPHKTAMSPHRFWDKDIQDEIAKGEDPFLPFVHVLYMHAANFLPTEIIFYVEENLKRDPSCPNLLCLALGANTTEPRYAKRLVTEIHRDTFDTFFKTESNFTGWEEQEDDTSALEMCTTALAVFLDREEFPAYFARFLDTIKRNTSPAFFRRELSELYAFDYLRSQPNGYATIQQRLQNMHKEGMDLFMNQKSF